MAVLMMVEEVMVSVSSRSGLGGRGGKEKVGEEGGKSEGSGKRLEVRSRSLSVSVSGAVLVRSGSTSVTDWTGLVSSTQLETRPAFLKTILLCYSYYVTMLLCYPYNCLGSSATVCVWH